MSRNKSIHFRLTLVVVAAIFLSGIVLFYAFCGRYTVEDKLSYEKLMYGEEDALSEPTRSRQVRFGMQRDASIKKDGEIHQFRLKSAYAELVLEKHHNDLQVVENMQDVDCWLQESVHPPSKETNANGASPEEQKIVVLHAESASYHHQKDLLIAENVNVVRYIAFGNDPKTAVDEGRKLLEGTAEKACASIADGSQKLIAELFKARIYDRGATEKKDCTTIESDRAEFCGDVITMHGNVRICYDDYFTATSESACCTLGASNGSGTATLYGTEPCTVQTEGGDIIHAADIQISLSPSTSEAPKQTAVFRFREVNGVLQANTVDKGKREMRPTNFSAGELIWDDAAQTITLLGDVKVTQEGIGQLDDADKVVIALVTVDGKKQVSQLVSSGESVLTHTDQESYLEHTLKCYGKVKVDHQKMEIRMLSPRGDDGGVLPESQVFFNDSKGKIYADRLFVKYDYVNGKIVPIRIFMQGNVKIANSFSRSENDAGMTQQYVLADSVEFFPLTKEMLFRGSKEHQVLLFDQVNNLQVSAPALKITRDEAVQRDMVKGLGNVRLNFMDAELDLLRQRFSFDKIGK